MVMRKMILSMKERQSWLPRLPLLDGTAQPAPVLEEVAAPEGAEVEVGGKSCKWCGSQTHLRRSHKDCPANKNKK